MNAIKLAKRLEVEYWEGSNADGERCSITVGVDGDYFIDGCHGDVTRNHNENFWVVEDDLLDACKYTGDRPLKSESLKEIVKVLDECTKKLPVTEMNSLYLHPDDYSYVIKDEDEVEDNT